MLLSSTDDRALPIWIVFTTQISGTIIVTLLKSISCMRLRKRLPTNEHPTVLELFKSHASAVKKIAYSTAGVLRYLPLIVSHLEAENVQLNSDEDIQMFADPADSHLKIFLFTSFKWLLHFLAHPLTWNACLNFRIIVTTFVVENPWEE